MAQKLWLIYTLLSYRCKRADISICQCYDIRVAKRINVKVIPRASKNKIIEEPDRLKVYVTSPAVDGKANKAVIEAIAEHFKVKKRNIAIIFGETNREKVIEIR